MNEKALMIQLNNAIEALPMEDSTLFREACGDMANMLFRYPELRTAYSNLLAVSIINAR